MASETYHIIDELQIAIYGFIIGLGTLPTYYAVGKGMAIPAFLLIAVIVYKLLSLIGNRKFMQILATAIFLGLTIDVGVYLAIYTTMSRYFGCYMMSLAMFHWSEYATTALFNAKTLSMDSFLLNHSVQYATAAIASWIEYFIELYFIPSLKSIHWLSCIGIIMVVSGDFIRKRSMFVAASNFNHIIATKKAPSHQLVTHDVYSLCRHPSYVGWFWWSVGTQVVLCNPICFIGYTLASWNFFNDRIQDEEVYLLQFFGQDYLDYIQKVGVGIPFIRGLQLSRTK